jgi:hypothetical protein
MTEILVFVNEKPVAVPPGSDARAAAARLDPALGERLARGEAHATDGRGIELPADQPLAAGAIVRVIVSARRREPDADA